MARVKSRPRTRAKPVKGDSVKATIAAAAAKYHVPFWLLWGVKVSETGSTGTGIGEVSSTGAQGPFQFEPGTAQEYGVNVNSVKSSAEGAARLLKKLKAQTGSWDGALKGYSGGGYGVAHVKEKAAEGGGVTPANSAEVAHNELASFGLEDLLPGGLGKSLLESQGVHIPGAPQLPGLGGGVGEGSPSPGVGSLLSFPKEITEAFTNATADLKLIQEPKFWIRVGEAVGGVMLLYIALKSLTGTGVSDIPGAKTASQAGKAAAFKRLPPSQRVKS